MKFKIVFQVQTENFIEIGSFSKIKGKHQKLFEKVKNSLTDYKTLQTLKKLFDYNLIIEKETLGHEQADIDFERERLEESNEQHSESLRQIFENRSQAQAELDMVEVEIKNALNKVLFNFRLIKFLIN